MSDKIESWLVKSNTTLQTTISKQLGKMAVVAKKDLEKYTSDAKEEIDDYLKKYLKLKLTTMMGDKTKKYLEDLSRKTSKYIEDVTVRTNTKTNKDIAKYLHEKVLLDDDSRPRCHDDCACYFEGQSFLAGCILRFIGERK